MTAPSLRHIATGGLAGGLLFLLTAEDPWPALTLVGQWLAAPVSWWTTGSVHPTLAPLLTLMGAGALASWPASQLGRALAATHPALATSLRRLRVTSASLTLPGGAELKLDATQVDALYPLYVELATRVSAYSLTLRGADGADEHIGDLGRAIDSLYGLFEPLRAALKQGDAPLAPTDNDPRTQVVRAISDSLRPFLSRWHPHWDRWKATGLPEARWPLHVACREDLERALATCRTIVATLGAVYGIPPSTQAATTPQSPHPYTHTAIGWGAAIDEARARLWRTLRIGALQLPSPPPDLDPAALRDQLLALRGLYEATREALAGLPTIPAEALTRPGEPRPDTQLLGWLDLLAGPLRLAPDARWPLSDTPSADLERLSAALRVAQVALDEATRLPPDHADRGELPSARA